jgi:hypothetical protein
MTFTDPGVLGAKRASYRETNPRPLLKTIMQQSTDEKVWRDKFWSEVEDDKDYLRAILAYWLDNTIRSILNEKPPEEAVPYTARIKAGQRTTQPTRQQVKNALHAQVERQVKIALLKLEMPNGKTLGECTGNECKRFGGWYAVLAKKVPANATVGGTLSESEVAALWRKSK